MFVRVVDFASKEGRGEVNFQYVLWECVKKNAARSILNAIMSKWKKHQLLLLEPAQLAVCLFQSCIVSKVHK